MTNQEIFDKVAKHLLTQNKKCISMNGCQYKNGHGLKCAIGCLIPDDRYDPVIEGVSVGKALRGSIHDTEYSAGHEVLCTILSDIGIIDLNSSLLSNLQCVHDRNDPSEWMELLRTVARKYRLSTKALKE